MPYGDIYTLMGVGGFFLICGLCVAIWGRIMEKKYYDSTSEHSDLREYMEHWPPRPQYWAWSVGGWISLAIGSLMLIAGGILWFRV